MHDPAPSFSPALPTPSIVARARAWLLLATAALAVVCAASAMRISEHGYTGASTSYDLVAFVEPGSPADLAGLRPGDRITRLDGVSFADVPFAEARLHTPVPHQQLRLEVERPGPMRTVVPITLEASFPPWSEVVWRLVLAAVGILCLGLAFLTFWQRPGALTLLFWSMLVCFAWLLREPLPATHDAARALSSLVDSAVQLALPGFLVHFFLLFPEPRPFLARRRWILALPYAMPVLLFVPVCVLLLREAGGTPPPGIWRTALERLSAVGFAVSTLASVALFIQSFVSTRADWARRRLRVALFGTIAGVGPVVAVMVWMTVQPTSASSDARYAVVSLLLVPLAFGYAIVRYQLLDARVIVRRGVAYSIATGMLIAVYASLVLGLGGMVQRITGRTSFGFTLVSICLIAALAAPLQSRVQALVDRVFFRRRYDYGATLRGVSHALATLMEVEALARLVVTRLAEAMQPERVALYVTQDPGADGATCARLAAYPAHDPLLPATLPVALVRALAANRAPVALEDRHASEGRVSRAERQALTQIGAAVVVPCVAEGGEPALLVLGPRRAGSWYTPDDLTLLATIGEQIGLGLLNARLSEARIQAARLERDLAVAREIQRHLLPTRMPQPRGVALAAVYEEAAIVGGDFYDAVEREDGRLAIALADVSGHGIPAALVLSAFSPAIAAGIRSDHGPAAILSSLTAHVAALDQPERFVACCIATFEHETRRLTVSVAGMPSPFVLRASGAIVPFESSGPPLGVLARVEYADASVVLEEGDVVVFATDGVSEQPGADGLYGDERLIEAARRARHLSAAEMLAEIQRDVRAYAAGPMDDDMTMLALAVTDAVSPAPAAPADDPHRASAAS